MALPSVPIWWTDIERSGNTAVTEFETVLNAVESALSLPDDKSPDNLKINVARWTALLKSATLMSGRLISSIRLAEARRRDASEMGFSPPDNPELSARAAEASRKFGILRDELHRRMFLVESEISGLHPRRRKNKLYIDNSPSHIDVHV